MYRFSPPCFYTNTGWTNACPHLHQHMDMQTRMNRAGHTDRHWLTAAPVQVGATRPRPPPRAHGVLTWTQSLAAEDERPIIRVTVPIRWFPLNTWGVSSCYRPRTRTQNTRTEPIHSIHGHPWMQAGAGQHQHHSYWTQTSELYPNFKNTLNTLDWCV